MPFASSASSWKIVPGNVVLCVWNKTTWEARVVHEVASSGTAYYTKMIWRAHRGKWVGQRYILGGQNTDDRIIANVFSDMEEAQIVIDILQTTYDDYQRQTKEAKTKMMIALKLATNNSD